MENAVDSECDFECPIPVLGAEVPIDSCAVTAVDHLRRPCAALEPLTYRAATFAERRRSDGQVYVMTHRETTAYASSRMPLEPLLTVAAVCELLGISKVTLYRLIRAGELKPTRVGERLRFEPDDVRAYLERNREAASVP
jgi:excisionase family DNA binding protein